MSSLHDYIASIRIIDGHEHLATPKLRRQDKTGLFGLLHYLESDLIAAGMERNALKRPGIGEEEKAAVFLKYWERTKNTTYARMFRTAMEDLYGMKDWSVNGLLELHGKVLEASADPEKLYRRVLVEKSGIDVAFTLIYTTDMGTPLLRPVMFMDFTYHLRKRNDIAAVEREAGIAVHTLRRYVDAVDAVFDRYVREGMVATKLGHAYWRTLACGKPDEAEAERVFNRLMRDSLNEGVSQPEAQPLQDYLIHHVIRRSVEAGMPIQIHTGHHETSVSGNGNTITNSRVTDLLPLLHEYAEAKFVLLHAGYPYMDEYMSVAKNFPNVYADMTWLYIISPTVAKRALHQLFEMVPQTKLQAFGGDYNYVEGTYAHQKLARKLVGEVLAEKVADGALDEAEAAELAERIFRRNLIELYGLREETGCQ
ncbi:hypothetical protein PACILC2_44080 [Paenibacillus cisolokensis]|uniref:Amidohydrolase-related domain-containing protein n=1 Tax=Paenibacillus cisolokensis TaxID=1658519 RepID=A0ABQ4NCC1_9BACL|nr:amidohydrolase family protein [Paenibacillus cisolokensis]GIQ65840.1 hypothetical protein PACILC2_44080 [Paenibacillus cisolokensis]